MDQLIWSDAILEVARSLRLRVAHDLRAAGIDAEVVVTGPASLPGVLTRGDVDLHCRVAAEEFASVVDRLRRLYRPTSPHSWGATLAVFDVPAERSTGLAATPVGSEHDRRFSLSWHRLREEPGLLAEYNALKIEHVGTETYEARKADFFTMISESA